MGVILVVVFGALLYSPPTSNASTVLARSGAAYGIEASQYVAWGFTVHAPSTLTGAVRTTWNVSIYLMSPAEFSHFVTTTVVSGYQWASGTISAGAFSAQVPVGAWQVVFVDPNPVQATNVVLTSDVQVAPS